jgi:hypothetical protein
MLKIDRHNISDPCCFGRCRIRAVRPGEYVLHSKSEGDCQALDWNVVVGPIQELVGVIGWNDMKSGRGVSGQLNPSTRTFMMTTTEVATSSLAMR